ncbi:hypothetical protein RND81_11G183800 [Saponaria officinalis]|uniref:Uncharacterized protein n=1 Tax=Saponaria officinalis TaxID=3572 RepID=A0AAW1HNS9_SAPOF
MDKSLYIAAMAGNTGFLREARDREIEIECWDQYLVSKTPQNNNIIHIASLYGHLDFIKTALTLIKNSPSKLMYEINGDGDTPLHIASKKGNFEIVQLLVCYSDLGGPALDRGGEIEVAAKDGDGQLHPDVYQPPSQEVYDGIAQRNIARSERQRAREQRGRSRSCFGASFGSPSS